MIIFKCKYWDRCGSYDNCKACRGKKDMIIEEVNKLCNSIKNEIPLCINQHAQIVGE